MLKLKNIFNRITHHDKLWATIFRLENELQSSRSIVSPLSLHSDYRLLRLEILSYYQDPARRAALDKEQLALLDYLNTQYDPRKYGRVFSEDPYYDTATEDPLPYPVIYDSHSDLWYADMDGKKLYLGENRKGAEQYLKAVAAEIETPNPHRYLEPEKDGIDIPEGSILLDIGAAEGFLGIKYIERCKKVYFFECEEHWLKCLKKSCEPFGDKAEIVKGFVGDGTKDIKLDEFFRNREKPTFIKIDVEGAEGSVLRGMPGLLSSRDPLTLLVCTYHRQEDWDRYSEMLKDNFIISPSTGWRWHMVDPCPPYFRRGVLRAVKKI